MAKKNKWQETADQERREKLWLAERLYEVVKTNGCIKQCPEYENCFWGWEISSHCKEAFLSEARRCSKPRERSYW